MMVDVKNYAGEEGGVLLRWFTEFADPTLLASWKGVGGGGNCYYATMSAAALIINEANSLPSKDKRKLLDETRFVTGRFVLPFGEGSNVVDHAWIERAIEGKSIVLNVSNLGMGKPLYVMPKKEYRDLNNCDKIYQKVSLRSLSNGHKGKALDPYSEDQIRRLVKTRLNKTLSQVEKNLVGPS